MGILLVNMFPKGIALEELLYNLHHCPLDNNNHNINKLTNINSSNTINITNISNFNNSFINHLPSLKIIILLILVQLLERHRRGLRTKTSVSFHDPNSKKILYLQPSCQPTNKQTSQPDIGLIFLIE